MVARDLGDEVVVLDPSSQLAHRLTGSDAQAWRQAGQLSADPALHEAATRLQSLGVLQPDGVSRRQVLARAGLVAASAPLVSLALPMVRAAASVDAITSFSVTTCANHTITQARVAVTGTKNQTYVLTFSALPNSGVTGPGLTGTGKTDGNSGQDNITVTGSLTAPGSGTFTVLWTSQDTSDNTVDSGTIQINFC